MSLQPADIAALSRLLDEAEDIPPDERPAWLAALPADQAHLAERLAPMLAERDRSTAASLLSTLPELGDTGPTASSGERVGPYRLLHEIGRGGMGSVWLAERADGHFDRQVALKLPRLSWAEGLGERMARERRIGALLEHPAIARLYDAGLDAQGRPYIAMEFIEGEPIDAFCRGRRPDVKAVLALFVQVVRAVAYAHGRLVIHRDLKPANVLVSSDGQAHLLDFGIAKLLDAEFDGDSPLTQEQGRMMTLHYAAPEQVAGQPVGVQADVYSLGVVLYELLTGVLPQTPRRSTAGAMEDAILDGDVPPASHRVSDKARQRELRGEVDAILGKALQRDPARRYATAEALADNIQRHLRGETVSARPDSLLYRAGKTLRRHWVGFGAAAAVLIAVVSGSAVAVVQAQRAARSAERERVVKEFVADVFRVNAKVDPKNAALRPATTQALLEGGAQLIQQRFAGQPELQAELYGVVGGVFSDMGAYSLAADYATKRIEALTTLRADELEQARALLALAQAMFDDGKFADAQARVARAMQMAGPKSAAHLDALVLLGRIHAEAFRAEEAKKALADIDTLLATRGPGPSTARAWAGWLQAWLLNRDNRLDEALPLYQQAIDMAVLSEGRLSLSAIAMRLSLASRLAETPDVDGATKQFSAGIKALRELGGPHAVRAAFESALFSSRRHIGFSQISSAEALAQLDRSRAELSSSTLPIPPWYLPSLDLRAASIHASRGDVAVAWPLLERAAPQLKSISTSNLNEEFRLASSTGSIAMIAGRHELAAHALQALKEIRTRTGGGLHPYAAGDYSRIARNLLMQGRLKEAEAVLDDVPRFEALRGEGMGPNRYNNFVIRVRAEVKLLLHDTPSALRLLQEAAPDRQDTANDKSAHNELLGEATCQVGRPIEGLRLLKSALAHEEARDNFEHAPWRAHLRAKTGLCALAAGDRKLALQLATQARAAFTAQPDVSPYYKAPLIQLEAALGLKPVRTARSPAETATPAQR